MAPSVIRVLREAEQEPPSQQTPEVAAKTKEILLEMSTPPPELGNEIQSSILNLTPNLQNYSFKR